MNTGIQDAHNLGWKLAAVAEGASPALLDSYDAERRPVAAGVLALSNARLEQTLERNGLVTRGDASTMQLTVGYRGSALARDDRDAPSLLRADDRAPDATRLTTVEPAGRDDIADTEGHLASAYDATDHTLVLIRPDGHVALISDASAVSHYLTAIG